MLDGQRYSKNRLRRLVGILQQFWDDRLRYVRGSRKFSWKLFYIKDVTIINQELIDLNFIACHLAIGL